MKEIKNKKQHKTAAEIKAELNEKSEQEIDKDVAQSIEAILVKSNRALQPFLERNDVATVARVRLVRVKPQADEKKEGSSN